MRRDRVSAAEELRKEEKEDELCLTVWSDPGLFNRNGPNAQRPPRHLLSQGMCPCWSLFLKALFLFSLPAFREER